MAAVGRQAGSLERTILSTAAYAVAFGATGACTTSAGTEPEHADLRVAIWLHRDQREVADGLLERALQHPDATVRFDAARSLAYARDARARPALERALGDADPLIRHEALYALAQLRGPVAPSVFAARLDDSEPGLRLLAAYGLARHGRPEELDLLAPLLRDPEAKVRGQAALSLLRLAGDRLRAPERGDEAARRRASALLQQALPGESDGGARWRIVYALAHLADPDAAGALCMQAARDVTDREQEWAVLFALRGLSALPPDPAIRALLLDALDRDAPSLVIEAIAALADPRHQAAPRRAADAPTYSGPDVLARLAKLSQDPRPQVRLVATEQLWRQGPDAVAPLREALRGSPNQQAAALPGLARLLPAAEALAAIDAAIAHEDDRVRAGAARALARLPAADALPRLRRLGADPVRSTGIAAAEALAAFRGADGVQQVLAELLAIDDLALREALAPAATALGDAAAVPALAAAYGSSPGLPFAEARKLLLESAAALDRTAAADLLASGLEDPDLVVRQAARRLLGRPPEPDDRQPGLVTPLPGETFGWGFPRSRPRIRFTTTKGEFEVQLSPASAPVHALNLLLLVEAGAYDGRRFHRVVPNFVVQGGDHRGDGSGARAWHGGQIRDEIGPVPFDAFTVGMPKSADDDTGGDQIFITTVPTPHLDGRYTAFGRVVRGTSVVESIEIGDRILTAIVRRE